MLFVYYLQNSLNSLSGIFANGNLSILFSSHVDIFQLEKSLELQNQQLLVPNETSSSSNTHETNTTPPSIQSTTINTVIVNDVEKPKSNYSKSSSSSTSPFTNTTKYLDKVVNKIKNAFNISLFDVNPYDLLAVKPTALKSDVLTVDSKVLENREPWQHQVNEDDANLYSWLPESEQNIVWKGVVRQLRNARKLARIKIENNNSEIKKIADIGLFPTTMNILEHCPDDKNRLCLNIMDDRVPGKSYITLNTILHLIVYN